DVEEGRELARVERPAGGGQAHGRVDPRPDADEERGRRGDARQGPHARADLLERGFLLAAARAALEVLLQLGHLLGRERAELLVEERRELFPRSIAAHGQLAFLPAVLPASSAARRRALARLRPDLTVPRAIPRASA